LALHRGDIIGEYRVLDVIGAGGMGAVYKVEHLITKRVEAMKALKTAIGIAPDDIRRFEREIQVQARLHHPNIAAVYSAVRDGDQLGLVMEYVEGESLQALLARQRLPVEAAVAVVADVLAALDYAHRAGVVHRDVSPANIIIPPTGGAKLTDFGLAFEAASGLVSAAGTPAGTACYMSPEQVRGLDGLDARSDVYSAGAVLYEALTGRRLFDADGAFAIMQCHVETAPSPPSEANPNVPAALNRAVGRALAKDPGARFPSAAEFRAAILEAAGERRRGGTGRRWAIFAAAALAAAACTGALMVRVHGNRAKVLPRPAPVVVQQPLPVAPPVAVPVQAEEAPPAPVIAERREVPAKKRAVRPKAPAAQVEDAVVAKPEPVAVEPAAAPEAGSAAADLTSLPAVPRPATLAVPGIPVPTVDSAQPQKAGNRFVRALGKINPFKRAPKEAAAPLTNGK